MNPRLARFLVAILLCASAASADPLGLLYNGEKLWHVNAFLSEGTVMETVNRMLKITTLSGAAIVVFCLFAEGARRFLGRDFEIQDVFTFLGKYLLVAIIVSTPNMWAWSIYAIITPSISFVDVVQSVGQEGAMQAFGQALLTAADAAYEGVDSLASTLFQQSVSAVVLGFASILALCISFAISLYVSVMWTILYVIGPALLPCVLFAPLSAIGWTWVRSFLAFCLMGVVGSMAMGLLIGGGMLLSAIKLGATADVIPAIAYAVVIVVVLVMVPRFTLALFDGIGPDPMGVAATMKSLAGAALSVGVVTAGAAAAGAGMAMDGAGSLGAKLASQGALKTASERLASAGESTRAFGNAAVKSQFSTMEKGMFPTFRSWSQKENDA